MEVSESRAESMLPALHVQPKISVIMPAFNAEKTIAEAIQSVCDQTWSNWELIVVNDGSADATSAIVRSFNDYRIRFFEQANSGVSEARNRALHVARGEFISFLDADDVLPCESLALRATLLIENPHADFSDGIVLVMDEQLHTPRRIYRPTASPCGILSRILALDSEAFFGPSYMIRRSVVGDIRFQRGQTHCEDMLFFVKVAHTHDSTAVVAGLPIYIYRQGVSTAMSNHLGLSAGYLGFFESVSRFLQGGHIGSRWVGKFKAAKIVFLMWCRRGAFVTATVWAFKILMAK